MNSKRMNIQSLRLRHSPYIPLTGNTEGEFKLFTLLLCVAPAI